MYQTARTAHACLRAPLLEQFLVAVTGMIECRGPGLGHYNLGWLINDGQCKNDLFCIDVPAGTLPRQEKSGPIYVIFGWTDHCNWGFNQLDVINNGWVGCHGYYIVLNVFVSVLPFTMRGKFHSMTVLRGNELRTCCYGYSPFPSTEWLFTSRNAEKIELVYSVIIVD